MAAKGEPKTEIDYAMLFRELYAELNWVDYRRAALRAAIEGFQRLVELDEHVGGKP